MEFEEVKDSNFKSTRWAFTAYEGQWGLFESIPPLIAEWGWQQEICPETQNIHYQGYIRTQRQLRHKQMREILPGVNIGAARNWAALLSYCKKTDTAVPGTQVHQEVVSTYLSMSDALIKIAENRPLDLDYSKCESPKEFRELHKYEFERSVSKILRQDSNLIGLYSQPQYERSYVIWRNDWVYLYEKRQTDRQTQLEEVRSETE